MRVERETAEPFLYRKNGRDVTYVIGDVAGSQESPVYAILNMSDAIDAIETPEGFRVEQRLVDFAIPGLRELLGYA